MRILLTRPAEDARETAAALEALGHEALIEPVLEIRFEDAVALQLDGVQALLATSRNGVRALLRTTPRRDLPLFAVGGGTAALARASGFQEVHDADGDVDDLTAFVARTLSPGDGPLLHAAGSERAGDLKAALEALGFTVRREVLYRAELVGALSGAVEAALADRRIDAVLFFSPRTARGFASLLARAGLTEAVRGMIAFCISPRAAAAVSDLPFRSVRAASRPNQAALLELLAAERAGD